jgi:hypothetical protein
MFIFFLWYPTGTQWLSQENKLNNDTLPYKTRMLTRAELFLCKMGVYTLQEKSEEVFTTNEWDLYAYTYRCEIRPTL